MNTGKPTPRPEDRDLEELALGYRELGRDEPPALLDQAVLNRARRAAERGRPWSWNLGWYHTIGTAAGVLLAVGVYLQMRTETPEVPAAPSPVAAESLRMRSDVGAGAEPVTEKEAANDRTAGRAEQQLARDSFASPASRDAAKAAEEKAEEAPVERLQAKRALPDDKAESAPLPGAEEWLRRLHELREAGDEEAFLEQLEAFRSAYPDHPLPEGWRD